MLDFRPPWNDHLPLPWDWSRPLRPARWLCQALPLLLLAGCTVLAPKAGTVNERSSDASEMYAQFQAQVREENVGQQYFYYSRKFKGRYNVWEYSLMVKGDPVIGGLFKRFVLDWPVAEIGYAKDHKTGWILLQHPQLPQYRKVLDTVAEYDEKLKCDQWKIDFSCAKWMGLPDSLEVRLIAEEEEWREKIKQGRGQKGPPKAPPPQPDPQKPAPEESPEEPPTEDPKPEGQPPQEAPHD